MNRAQLQSMRIFCQTVKLVSVDYKFVFSLCAIDGSEQTLNPMIAQGAPRCKPRRLLNFRSTTLSHVDQAAACMAGDSVHQWPLLEREYSWAQVYTRVVAYKSHTSNQMNRKAPNLFCARLSITQSKCSSLSGRTNIDLGGPPGFTNGGCKYGPQINLPVNPKDNITGEPLTT